MGRAAAQECPSAFWQHWQAPFFVFNRPPFARKSRSWKKTIASGSREMSLTSSRKTKRTRSCGSPQTKLGTSSSKTFGPFEIPIPDHHPTPTRRSEERRVGKESARKRTSEE